MTLFHRRVRSFNSSGGPGSISVTTSETTCSWSASEGVDWIDITSGSSGIGNGTVTYTVSANTTGSSRTAVITVGGQSSHGDSEQPYGRIIQFLRRVSRLTPAAVRAVSA